ncbi:MAG: LLM class flavin-dependent oxidoreductase [Conexivisphaerales archaeon]
MNIKFGVHTAVDMNPENMRRDIEMIGSLGFDGIYVSDSIGSSYDPLVLLSALSQITNNLRLGTCVYLLPLRHPIITARQVSTLQKLSDERIIFGVGVGWRKNEFDSLGIDFGRRGTIADESIQILRQAWQKGSVDFDGKFYKIHIEEVGSKLGALPSVWVGGNSKAAIKRACLFGDGWIPTDMTPEEYELNLPLIKDYLARFNRERSEFRLASHLMLILSEERERAENVARAMAANFSSTLEEIKQWALVGNTEDIVERLALYSKIGVSYHILSTWAYPAKDEIFNMLKLFSREVIPSF